MGEAFISNKKERFEHQRDKEFEKQLGTPDLMSRMTEVTTTVYKCVLNSKDTPVQHGDGVLVVDLGESHVSVLWRNQVVGYVQAHDGQKIRAIFSGSPQKMLAGQVHSVSTIGKTFSITLDS